MGDGLMNREMKEYAITPICTSNEQALRTNYLPESPLCRICGGKGVIVIPSNHRVWEISQSPVEINSSYCEYIPEAATENDKYKIT